MDVDGWMDIGNFNVRSKAAVAGASLITACTELRTKNESKK